MIGGPLSAFHPQGVNIDTPVHYDCGKYALQFCPYSAVSPYSAKSQTGLFKIDDFANMLFHNPSINSERVPVFFFLKFYILLLDVEISIDI
jgi:hypothetical protein